MKPEANDSGINKRRVFDFHTQDSELLLDSLRHKNSQNIV